MSEVVLDSSAVLAVLFEEPGAEEVLAVSRTAVLGAVNRAEVLSKLCERGLGPEEAAGDLGVLSLQVVPFTEDQALRTAALRPLTRRFGLSLGDRACLALAAQRRASVLTAERRWTAEVEAAAGVTIRRIRGPGGG